MIEVELKKIVGGASISSTMLNAIARLINTMLELGRSVGTAIARSRSGKMCA